MGTKAATLGDLGERRLICEVIVPQLGGDLATGELGNDCAFVEVGHTVLAISADVGPKPLIWFLSGIARDYEAAGWYAVLATASDIATAGAAPRYLTNCIEAPRDFLVADLEGFLRGFARACRRFGFKSAGGDIREGASFGCRVSGAGELVGTRRIGRSKAAPGDHLFCIGDLGIFIAGFLTATTQGLNVLDKQMVNRLRFPLAKSPEMKILAQENLVLAASDASDGVLAALENVLQESGVGAHLDLESSSLNAFVRHTAREYGYNSWNLAFCWGDWQIIVVVPAGQNERMMEVCREHAIEFRYLGVCTGESREMTACVDGAKVHVHPIRNENFGKCSYNKNPLEHLEMMLSSNLFTEL